MKKMILACLVGITIALGSGCASSSEKTPPPDLNSTTTSDIHAK